MELLLYVMTLNFMFEMGLLSIPFRILFLGDYTKSDRSAVFFLADCSLLADARHMQNPCEAW